MIRSQEEMVDILLGVSKYPEIQTTFPKINETETTFNLEPSINKTEPVPEKILNIPMVTIRWRVRSNNKKFNNYQYKE